MNDSVEPVGIIRDQVVELANGLIALAPNLIAAIVVLLLTWLGAKLTARFVGAVGRQGSMRPSLRRALQSLAKIGIWIAGSLVAATIVFPNLTPASLLAGLGIGSLAIGLAFKDIFENYLAGLLVLLRTPMRIGDDIDCQDVSGRVEEITIRDTYIRKRSGELVLVPNSFIYKNPTTVVTDLPQRRVSLVVGVAYGENVDHARDVIRKALQDTVGDETDRPVEVFAKEFSSSSIDFLVRWWTGSAPIEEHRSRDRAVAAIKAALDTAGIEIPFPYRTITFKEPTNVRVLENGPS
jgi:small conductance mechanosensitive channel